MDPQKTQLPEKLKQIPLPATNPRQTQRNVKARLVRALWHVASLTAVLIVVNGLVYRKDVKDQHRPRPGHGHGHKHLPSKERERLFLYVRPSKLLFPVLTFRRSTPNAESALAASRSYATHPHLAGSSEDFTDAKVILELFQTEFGISPPSTEPIFPAGSPESRAATLHLTNRKSYKPSAWIDTYYPVLNTPVDHSLEILGENNDVAWSADLEEDGDSLDEDAHKYKDSVSTWHGLSKDGTAEGQLVYANYGTKEVRHLICL